MTTAAVTANIVKSGPLHGYRGSGDVTFEYDGKLLTDIAWVIFEVRDGQPNDVRGVVGTFNNYATLQLVWLYRTKKPLRVYGRFDDGTTGPSEWSFDNIAISGMWVRDSTGFMGFRATAHNTNY